MKKILSIDGGGIRGIVPGTILNILEKKLQKKSNNPHARLSDFFDFMAGTSTGGILTCLYLTPDKKDSDRARFSAQEAVDLYIKNGGSIFDIPTWKKLESMGGLTDERYDVMILEKLLHSYFGSLKLSELIKPCLISSYDIKSRRAHFFTQADALLRGDSYDYYVKDVCRATSAAPTYFETALIKSLSKVSYPLIDGGVIVNNPAMCAYSEVRNAKGESKDDKVTAADMFILSLGTGSEQKSFEYSKAKNWGMVSWLTPLLDIMMSGSSEVTDFYLKKIFDAVNRPHQYARISPTKMYNADTNMADATPENLAALVELGTLCAQENEDELERIANLLVEDKSDKVVFEY